MSLLFVHDVKADISNDLVYARSYGYNIWSERYLPSFNSMIICFRTRPTNEDLHGKVDLSTGPNVQFEKRIGMFKGPEVFFNGRIKRIIQEDMAKSDAVIVRLDSFLGLLTIRECRKINKPYIIELVGCAWDSFWNHGLTGKILAPYLFLRTRKEVYQAPYVIYVTKAFLQHRYPTKGLNTNISNVKLTSQLEADLEERVRKINCHDGAYTLGTAANVDVKYKGQQYVIKALGILKKKGITNYRYQILGDGDQSFLKRIAEENGVQQQVQFLGSVSHEKVFEWLRNDVDIYIQPSMQEGLPRSVIEAMSLGVPCIGSDVAGIPELLDSKWVFNRKKCKELEIAKLLRKMTKDEMLLQANRNFEEAKLYNFDVLQNRRKSFFERFISENIK